MFVFFFMRFCYCIFFFVVFFVRGVFFVTISIVIFTITGFITIVFSSFKFIIRSFVVKLFIRVIFNVFQVRGIYIKVGVTYIVTFFQFYYCIIFIVFFNFTFFERAYGGFKIRKCLCVFLVYYFIKGIIFRRQIFKDYRYKQCIRDSFISCFKGRRGRFCFY